MFTYVVCYFWKHNTVQIYVKIDVFNQIEGYGVENNIVCKTEYIGITCEFNIF